MDVRQFCNSKLQNCSQKNAHNTKKLVFVTEEDEEVQSVVGGWITLRYMYKIHNMQHH